MMSLSSFKVTYKMETGMGNSDFTKESDWGQRQNLL